MRTQFTGDSAAQTALKIADTYMASGHWEAAESLLRKYGTEQADLNLRLAQFLAPRRYTPVKATKTGFSFYPTTLSSEAQKRALEGF